MSNRPLRIIAAGFAAISLAPVAGARASAPTTPALARPAAPPAARAPRPVTRAEMVRDLDANYKRLDVNNDGDVTQSEIRAAQARAEQTVEAQIVKRRADGFVRLDTNKDGQLSLAEFNAAAPIAPRHKADPSQVVQRMDANNDQKVSIAEFRAPSLATFDKMDLNGDGTVSIDEQLKSRRGGK